MTSHCARLEDYCESGEDIKTYLVVGRDINPLGGRELWTRDRMTSMLNMSARKADQHHGGTEPGQVRRVEGKLLSYPKVEGLVNGNWGKASEATSRARVAEPQTNRRGINLSEEGLKGMAVSYGGGQG